jgi:hypothetical protein
MLMPKNARQLSPPSLSSLFQRFPILRISIDFDDAETEWREHVNLPDDYFGVSSYHEFFGLDPEFYWNRVFDSKTPAGHPQFSNLKVCISLLFSLPFSNARAECCFSALRDVKSLKRNKLHDKSVDGIIKGKQWMGKRKASQVHIPDSLYNLVKKVKSNKSIGEESSESES